MRAASCSAMPIPSRLVRMRLCIAIASLFASAGCATSVRAFRPVSPEMVAQINDAVSGKRATVKFGDTDRAIDTKDVRLSESSLRFLERSPASAWNLSSRLPEREAPVASVQSIKVRNRSRGALHGLAIGAGIGVVSGGIAGLVLGAVVSQNERSSGGVGTGALFGAAVVGIAFGLIGAGIGAAVGAPTTVEFTNAPTP
jgi:hypothetical protein